MQYPADVELYNQLYKERTAQLRRTAQASILLRQSGMNLRPFLEQTPHWIYPVLIVVACSLLGCTASPHQADTTAVSSSNALRTEYYMRSVASVGGLPSTVLAQSGPQCVYRGSPPIAVSRRRAVLRILTQNAFGLDNDGNDNCEERATRLGSIIANAMTPYDIVALQEHWNSLDLGIFDCGGDQLQDAIWSTGRYGNSNNYFRNRPQGEVLDGETDGGLSIFTLHPIEEFDENEWDEIPREFGIKTLHGSTFSRIKLVGTNVSIDFYNTHLLAQEADDCDQDCRRKELQELRSEIILHSKTSGNPVLVVGDFNIGGPPSCHGNGRYTDIMEVLENPRDLWLEAHPNLDGFTADCDRNTVKRQVEGACGTHDRIDYIFLVQSPNLTNSRFEVVLREANDLQLAEFVRSSGQHVSDHFGLEAFLEIRERGRVDTPFVGLAQKCLEVSGGLASDGAPLQISTCNGGAAQRWTLGYDGQMRGIGGKCLTVRNGDTANGTPVEVNACTGSAAQRFDYTAAGELRSRLDATKCVDVRGGLTNDGTPIQISDCSGSVAQKWKDFLPPVVNVTECARIAAEISEQRQALQNEKNINERKRILKAIGALEDRSERLNCP